MAVAQTNLIVGTEDFLAERRRQEVVAAARKEAGNEEVPVEMHKTSELNEPELAELLSPSLFAENRIIFITGVEEAGKEVVSLLEEAIKHPADGIVLIIRHTGKGRNKKLVTAWPKLGMTVLNAGELKGREKNAFIDQEFRRLGTRVSPDVVEELLDGVGGDLRELSSAISQLVADTDGKVTPAEVRKYYRGKAEVSGFDIADFAVTGQKERAVASARRALQLGEAPVLIASALSQSVSGISKVAGAGPIDPRRQAAEFGMPPWKLEKLIRIARRWSPAAVSQAVQVTAELDAGVKGHSYDMDFAVEQAVRKIADLAG